MADTKKTVTVTTTKPVSDGGVEYEAGASVELPLHKAATWIASGYAEGNVVYGSDAEAAEAPAAPSSKRERERERI